ncbi:MAG TPA: hypothetical protein PK781_00890 [Terrimesophilobacter sp.]|nr:hypothetical protein [Terrimesophilobacter sp.]HRP98997.1 hypothetical protein [Terrimesophilobacter sp.]
MTLQLKNVSRTNAAVGLALVAGLILAGCSTPATEAPEVPTSTEAPAETPSETPAETPAEPTTPGDVVEPGATVPIGEWASYEYSGLDDTSAIISARLVSAEAPSAEDAAFLVSEIPQLQGYELVFFTIEQKKVSGDEIAHQADYTGFRPATSDRKRAQDVTVIGWDKCKTNAFSRDFDTAGATLTQCIIGAKVPGGQDIAGIMYAPFDTPYNYSDGNPILFTK